MAMMILITLTVPVSHPTYSTIGSDDRDHGGFCGTDCDDLDHGDEFDDDFGGGP